VNIDYILTQHCMAFSMSQNSYVLFEVETAIFVYDANEMVYCNE